MDSDEEYARARRTDRVYFSKEFRSASSAGLRPARFLFRVFDSGGRDSLVEVRDEVVVRITPSGREQIKALFYVDSREIETLTLQRFSRPGDVPRRDVSFSLHGDEIKKLLEVASLIKCSSIVGKDGIRIDEADLEQYVITKGAARALAKRDLDLVVDVAENEITHRDIVAIAYRRNQLERFRRLLYEPGFFVSEKARAALTSEGLWQQFFERNTWIFGYGLFYIFTSGLSGDKLEQTVAGFSVQGAGKRADALLKTHGRVSSMCFVEIKTHETRLLEGQPYRSDAWAPSRDLAGAVAQVQRTVQSAEEHIGKRLDPRDQEGNPTGPSVYVFRPRSVLVIGDLAEFEFESRINEPKFSSFELFRRQLQAPEVVTFDELYERAKFIAETPQSENLENPL